MMARFMSVAPELSGSCTHVRLPRVHELEPNRLTVLGFLPVTASPHSIEQ